MSEQQDVNSETTQNSNNDDKKKDGNYYQRLNKVQMNYLIKIKIILLLLIIMKMMSLFMEKMNKYLIQMKNWKKGKEIQNKIQEICMTIKIKSIMDMTLQK